jgi:hypothetical protein
MKYIFILYLACIFSFYSCSEDEEELSPSNLNEDYYKRIDNPDNEVDHLIYEIYEETGIAILYNDTVGRIPIGTDIYGNESFLYEITDLSYVMDGSSGVSKKFMEFTPVAEQEDLLNGVNFLYDYVIPVIKGNISVNSFLLADELFQHYTPGYPPGAASYKVYYNIHEAFSTIAIANILELADSTETYKQDKKREILTVIYGSKIAKDFTNELDKFYAFSFSDTYNVSFYYQNLSSWMSTPASWGLPLVPVEEYGFLDTSENYTSKTPKRPTDVKHYIEMYFSKSQEEVLEQYSSYPLVLSKYGIISEIMSTINKVNE